MNVDAPHPELETFALWLLGEVTGASARELESHLDSCRRCRHDVAILGDLRAVLEEPATAVPDELARQLRELPTGEEILPAPAEMRTLRWTPSDVRSLGVKEVPESHLLARSLPEAEISVMALPPRGDGPWHFEGRIWLQEDASGSIRVLLVQEDHVISVARLSDGGRFAMDEVVGRGWVLEVHLPSGRAVRIEEPRS